MDSLSSVSFIIKQILATKAASYVLLDSHHLFLVSVEPRHVGKSRSTT